MECFARRVLRPLLAVVIVGSAVLAGPAAPADAAYRNFGAPRFSTTEPGDIIMAANTLFTCAASAACADTQNGVGPARANNDYNMVRVDVDNALGLDPGGVTNISSAANLNLPAGAVVRFAGLYWGATSNNAANRPNVRFATPNSGGYLSLTASQVDDNGGGVTYQSFLDVTALVQSGGAGQYVVGGIEAQTGAGRHAGWSLVVVFGDTNQPYRNLTVFDGFQQVTTGNPINITVSGFLTPPTGPVTGQIGFVTYEGDDRFIGDFAQLNGQQLNDSANPATNFFNSRISDSGLLITTKNPNYVDQLGFDATITNTVGVIPAGATSATITMDSAGDWYYPGVVTAAIDVYVPNLVLDLSKTVTDDNGGDVNPGDILTYDVTFSNQGDDAGLDVVMTDAIPTNTSYVPGSLEVLSGDNPGAKTDTAGDDTAFFDSPGNQVVFHLGTSATPTAGGRVAPFSTSGTTYDIRFKVQVDPGTEGLTAVNEAVLSYTGETIPDSYSSPTNQTSSDIVAMADVKLTAKSDSQDPVRAGSALTWVIDAANDGPSTAANVVITDTLPSGLVFDPASSDPRCTESSGVVTCTLGSLGAAATDSVTIGVDVPPSMAGGTFTNTAQISTTTQDRTTSDDFATEQTTVERFVDLEVTKTATPNPLSPPNAAIAGEQIDYAVTVSNNGPASATNVQLTDLLPAGTTLAGSSSGGSCTTSPGSISCSWPSIAVGAFETLFLTVDVDPDQASGSTLLNSASATADEAEITPGQPNNDSTSTPTVTSADLSLIKSTADAAVAGSTLTWDLVVANNGPSHARNVVVSDPLPTGTTFVVGLSSSSCTESAGVVSCTIPQIDNGSSVPLAIGVRVNPTVNQGTVITNTASVSADDPDPDSANNSASDTVTVSRLSDLSIIKTGPGTVGAGGQIDYTLAVTNAGPSAATNVQISDSLPSEVTLSSAPGCSGTTVITCTVASLAVGATANFTVTVDVPGTVADGINLVNSSSVAADETDPNSGDNTSQLTTTTDRTTQLELTKAESVGITDPVLAGTPVSWDLTLSNLSASADSNVILNDDLTGQPVVGPISATLSGATGSCSVSGLAVSCTIPTLPGNSSATVMVSGTADPAASSGDVIYNGADAVGDFSSLVTGVEETTISAQSDLTVAKTGPSDIIAGESGVWTITVSNTGPAQAQNVQATDLLPPGVSYVSSVTSPGSVTCTPVGANVSCSIGSLAPGATATMDVTALVDRNSPAGSISNSVSVTSSTADPDGSSNAASVPTSVTRSADLEFSKTATTPSTSAGETVSFALTTTNLGPSMATGVVITDTLDPAFVFNPALSDASCAQSGLDVVCNIGNVDPLAGPVTVNLTFDVDSAQTPGSYTNSASVAANETDPDSANNADSANFVVDALADLSVAKTSSASPAVPGEDYSYQLQVTNNGPSDALSNSIVDTLPAGTSLASGSSPGCSESPAGTVTCPVADLAPTATETVSIVVATDPAITGTLQNTATVNGATVDPDGSNNQSTDSTPLIPAANISMSKTAPATVNAGGVITWTLVVTNTGPSVATNPVATDTLPPQVTFSAASNPLCTATGADVTCTLPDLAPGGTISLDVVANVSVSAVEGTLLTNAADASSAVADPDTTNNSDSDSSRVTRSADISLTKTATGTAVAGGTATFDLIMVNNGPSAASAVAFTDTFVPELTPISATPVGGGTCSISGQTVTCSASQLLPGQSVDATIEASVDPNASVGDVISNTATSSATENDPAPGNNSSTDTITIEREADLSLAKTASQPTGVAGEAVTWLLQVTNLGPSQASGVEVSDVLGPDRTFDPAGSSPGCSLAGSTVTCSQANLDNADTTVFTVSTILSSDLAEGATVSNTATVTANEIDANTGNNDSVALVTVTTSADLAITKSSPATPPVPGSVVVWPISVSNSGPSDATAVVVTDTLPSGTTFNSTQSSPACALAGPGVVECSVASIPAGQTLDLDLAVDVLSSRIGSLTNSAVVTSDTDDSQGANNSDSTSDALVPTADIAVSKTALTDPAVAGQDVQWQIDVTNLGPSDAAGVEITDTLGPDLTYVDGSSDPRCDPSGSDISCVIGMMPAGSSTTLVLTSALSTSVFDGSLVTNQATASATTSDPNSGNDTANASATVTREADLTITKTASTAAVDAGSVAVWDIVVVNNGPSDATGIVVSDVLPSGAVFDPTTSSLGCSESGGTVSCPTNDLIIGSGVNLTIGMTLPSSLADGSSVTNTATVAGADPDPDTANNTSSGSISVTRQADLLVEKQQPTSPVVPGQPTSWSVDVTNLGPSDASTVDVSDTLPPGTTFDASGSDPRCTEPTPGTVSCAITSVAAGTAEFVVVSVDVPPGRTADLTNQASASAIEPDPNAANNSSTVVSSVDPQADLETTKALLTDPVVAGDVVVWSISVTNNGPSDSDGVVTTDAFGSSMSFNASGSDPSCTPSGSDVICSHGLIAAGATSTATIAFDLDPAASDGSTVSNTATTASSTPDPDTNNNNSSASGTVTQVSDLSVIKSANDSAAIAGGDTSFQIAVTNNGPSNSSNVVITDPVPAGAVFNPTDSDSSCSLVGSDVVCVVGLLAAGDSQSIRIGFSVDPTFGDGQTLTNSANVTADQPDPDSSNNSDTAAVGVVRSADLVASKSLNGQAVPGAVTQWTLGVINAGPSQATNVVITDTLDPRATFQPGASSPGCSETTPGTIDCTIGTVEAGSSSTVVVGVVIDSDATGTLGNSVSVAGSETDPNSSNNSTTQTSTLAPEADLVVTKAINTSPVAAGDEALWTVTVANLGPSDATNVTVQDQADSFVTFEPSSSDPSCSAGSPVACTTPAIVAGGSQSFVLAFVIDPTTADGTLLSNTATASSPTSDPDGTNNGATASGAVSTSADLSLAKFSLTADPHVGEPTTWQLSVNNPGPSVARDVVVTDSVPAGLTFDAAASDPACSLNGSAIECTYAALAPNTTTTADITFDINSGVADGATITNSASVNASTPDPNSANNTAANSITPRRSSDLRMVKTHSGSAIAGDPTSWALAVTNLGPSDSTGAVVTDSLPAGTTFNASLSDPACSESTPGEVSCLIGDLTNGSGTSIQVAVDLASDITGQITNTASAAANEADPDPANSTDSSTVDVATSADLLVVKTLLTADPTPGLPVQWQVTISNLGPSDATSVEVTDSFGPELLYDELSSDSRCALDTPGSTICDLATMSAGSSTDLLITFNSEPTILDNAELTNTAMVSSSTDDPEGSNDSSSSPATFTRESDVTVTKVGPSSVVAGNPISYDLIMTNNGPSEASNPVLADAVPSEIISLAVTGHPSCTTSANSVTCTPAQLAAGESITATINGVVSSNTVDGAATTNTATGSSDSADPQAANDSASVTTDITREVDLALSKTLLGAIVAGREVLWELAVVNNGPSDASGLVISDTLPSGLTFRPDLSSAGCSAGVTCSIGLLPAGQTVTIVIGSEADPGLPLGDTLTNTASVTSAETETDPSTNQASASGTVVRETDLSIVKQGPASPITAGTAFVWTLDLGNAGPSDATGVVAVDTLPSGTTFDPAASDPRCTASGNVVTCSVGDLSAGSSDAVAIGVDVLPSVNDGDVLTNAATVSADQGDPDTADNSSQHSVDVARSSGLTISKVDAADPVIAGDQVTWSVTVGNPAGPSDTANVVITDTLPAGVTFNSTLSDSACTAGPGSTVSCSLGTVVVGGSGTVEIVGDLDPSLAEGTILDNQATATGQGATPVSTSEETTVTRVVDLSASKVASTPTVTPGVPFTYEITVGNSGPSDASGVSVLDALPPGSVVTSVSPSPGCGATAGSVTCDLGTINAGASQLIVIELTPEPWLADGSNFDNNAVVSANEPDSDNSNDNGQSVAPVERIVEVGITKVISQPNPSAGDSVTFDIVASNQGPSDATGLTITDDLPAGTTFNPGLSSPGCSLSGVTVSCPLSSVPVGSSGSVVIGVDIAPSTTGDLTNTASVVTAETNTNPDPTATADFTVAELADLTIGKTAPAAVVAGEVLSFTLEVANNGPGLARNVQVSDTLSAELAVNSLDTRCSSNGNQVDCDLGDLVVGDSTTVILETVVSSDASQPIVNSASVQSDASETASADNVASSTTAVSQVADLAVSKAAVSTDAVAGGEVDWLIEVLNQGPSQATDVTLTDLLPSSLEFVPAGSDQDCSANGSLVTCQLEDIAVGESATVSLITKVADDAFGVITNTATAQSSQDDSNPATATANAVVDVRRPDAELRVSKSGSKSPLRTGDLVTWTVVISNVGAEPILNTIAVTDTLPADHELVSIVPGSPTCVETGGVINCELSNLPAGESIELRIRTKVLVDQNEAINTVKVSTTGINGGSGDDGSVVVTATDQVPASSGLAFTGSSLALMLLIALGLVLSGWFFLFVGKRRKDDEEDDPDTDVESVLAGL